MLLVLILPDEQFAKTTVVLVNKVLIIAYDIKQQTTIITLRKTNRIKPETHSYSFFPFDIYIYKVLFLKPELELNILPFTFAWKCLTVLRLAAFGDFRKKKRLNARGFAQEFLRSGILYRPGKSLKRRSKSSSLHSKKIFLLGAYGFFESDVISRGLLGHLGPLCLALGANR